MTAEPTDRLEETWATGSYARFAHHYLPMAGQLVVSTGVDADDRVLDVGCGTGNVAISAARRGACVRGVDITPAMLDQARKNAAVAGVDGIDWHDGDTTDLPFETDAFDATLSSLGHIYGTPAEAAGRELIRVTRSGGRLAFTSWTPTGLFPVVAGLVTSYLPQSERPEFTEPPFMWGDPDVVRNRLGPAVDHLEFVTETLAFPALSPGHFWQYLADHSGQFIEFLEHVEDRSSLREEVVSTVEPYFDERANAIELEYILVTGTVAD